LDGVITDTAQLHGQAWHKTADSVNTEWTSELAAGLKGISRMDSLEMILAAGGHAGEYTQAQKEQLAEDKNNYYKTLIATLTPADILPGMAAFLKELKDGGYKLSVASASKNAPTILKGLGISDLFDGIVDPASLHAGKPDPEIFAKGAELLNLQPNEVIGLEDSTAGLKSINGAGEVSLGIGDAQEMHEANIIFADTSMVSLANIATSDYFAK
jgi:beta-phosphoglucomutase